MCDARLCCRICLDVESDHVSILEDPTVMLHMKSCLTVTVSPNDHLPKTVCVSCTSQLTQFYNFQLNARCSQDWLECSLQEKKKSIESKMPLQPLPDSEYNSDSLLEFLNNTANIEEYLNNLGKEDIPSIVNMLDRNEHAIDVSRPYNFKGKLPSPKKKDTKPKSDIKMKIDVLDSDLEIVKEILLKEDKAKPMKDKSLHSCFACKSKSENLQKLLQHMSVCDLASRTCMQCNTLFDSKTQMQQHSLIHSQSLPFTCNCGEQFQARDKLIKHHRVCHLDYGASLGCTYSCKRCGDTFKERFELYKHAKKHILKAEEKICDVCGHTCIGNDALVRHKETHNRKPNEVMYRCKVCFQTFTDRKEIYLHVQKHVTKSEDTRHLCESCGKSFATLSTLMRHFLQHASKGVKCHICSRVFTHEKLRDEHVSLEHITVCEKCGQALSSTKLDVHCCV